MYTCCPLLVFLLSHLFGSRPVPPGSSPTSMTRSWTTLCPESLCCTCDPAGRCSSSSHTSGSSPACPAARTRRTTSSRTSRCVSSSWSVSAFTLDGGHFCERAPPLNFLFSCVHAQCADGKVEALSDALQATVATWKSRIPAPLPLELYTSSTFIGLFVEEEVAEVLKGFAADFATEAAAKAGLSPFVSSQM